MTQTEPGAVDWNAVHDEALDTFVRYLRIDSSNPPGREAEGARFLQSIIEGEGIPCEYFESEPGRAFAVARLSGDGTKRPLMLCNHIDVVPVEAAYWDHPPFGGEIHEGRVYGRGAVDMKGAGIMHLMALLLAKRQGLRLSRDIVFAAVPDEEAASVLGMVWLCEHRPDLVDVEFALSEGGSGQPDFADKDARLFGVATNEKEISLAARRGRRYARPRQPAARGQLGRPPPACARPPRGLGPRHHLHARDARLRRATVRGRPAPHRGPRSPRGDDRSTARAAGVILEHAQHHHDRRGREGERHPRERASAVLDCRLLPGQSRDDWRREVEARIADPRIEVTFHEQTLAEPPVPVEWDTELYRMIESVVHEAVEDAVVVPTMSVLGTDNRFLRRAGIPAYGFIPCLLSPEERAGFHGNNEFLTVENLRMGVELMYEIVRRMCT